MAAPYNWTTTEEETATDAIIVGIRGTSVDMLITGLPYIEPSASIYWSAQVGPDGQVHEAGGEMGPWLVPDALARAEELRTQFGFSRTIIVVADRDIWRDDWGCLSEQEGHS